MKSKKEKAFEDKLEFITYVVVNIIVMTVWLYLAIFRWEDINPDIQKYFVQGVIVMYILLYIAYRMPVVLVDKFMKRRGKS